MNLKPYPEYKNVRLPWLTRIPSNWELHRSKNLFRKMERDVSSKDEVVTCFRDGTVTLRKNRRTTGFTESLKEIGYQGVQKGDLVIHEMDAFAGAIGVSDSNGKCTPVYSVCAANKNINSHYFAFLLREMARIGYIHSLSKGIRERSTDFRFSTFKSLYLPLPSLLEQKAIYNFLKEKTTLINLFLLAKHKLIKLLQEQKKAVINRAVTRGLDPNVKLKHSGVDWLGEIPEHWEEKRGKYIFREVDERSKDGNEELLSVSHITGVTPRSQKNITMFKAESYVDSKICHPGDLVVNTMWAWMAALGISNYTGIVSPSYHVYRITNPNYYHNSYLDLLLRTRGLRIEYLLRSTGIRSSRLRMYPDKFLDIYFPIPPLDEQKKILSYINNEILEIDSLLNHYRREIELIEEYRTRLIADVVTGKLDVRNVHINEEPEPA